VLGKTALYKLPIVKKKNVTFRPVVTDSSTQPLKDIFDIQHLYSAWVADAIGFRVR
jgi:hypothetical protein